MVRRCGRIEKDDYFVLLLRVIGIDQGGAFFKFSYKKDL